MGITDAAVGQSQQVFSKICTSSCGASRTRMSAATDLIAGAGSELDILNKQINGVKG
jgi:hypothetical protein